METEPETDEPLPAETAPAPPTETIRPRLEIRQLRVLQPPAIGTPGPILAVGQAFEGSVKGSMPFALELDVELTGPAAPGVARQQVKCSVRAYAYDRAGGGSILLADSGPFALQPEEFVYTFALPEVVLPRGTYSLLVEVKPPSATVILPDYIEVPVFTVD